jgi:hypothetical protein
MVQHILVSNESRAYHRHLTALSCLVALVAKALVHDRRQAEAAPEENTRLAVLA